MQFTDLWNRCTQRLYSFSLSSWWETFLHNRDHTHKKILIQDFCFFLVCLLPLFFVYVYTCGSVLAFPCVSGIFTLYYSTPHLTPLAVCVSGLGTCVLFLQILPLNEWQIIKHSIKEGWYTPNEAWPLAQKLSSRMSSLLFLIKQKWMVTNISVIFFFYCAAYSFGIALCEEQANI